MLQEWEKMQRKEVSQFWLGGLGDVTDSREGDATVKRLQQSHHMSQDCDYMSQDSDNTSQDCDDMSQDCDNMSDVKEL